VKILGGTVESAYRWKGKVETAKERMLMIKTSARLLKKVETEIRRSHSYEVPEFLVIEVAGGSAEYLRWLRESLGK
jgi:periplasmic divalent cation tolerance protein